MYPFFGSDFTPENGSAIVPLFQDQEQKEEDKEKRSRGRQEYYFDMLRDPVTNDIPIDIRERELAYARTLPTYEAAFKTAPGQTTNVLQWAEAGPNDVGGRTRALGVDRRQNGVIIAGGVSGGIWRSDNNGQSWTKRTPLDGNLSIVSLTQDPNFPNTWYASMGEYSGNSASDRGFRAFYYGAGLYRSTDNGLTWTFIQKATSAFPASWTTGFHYTSKIYVSPHDGNLYLSSNALGLSMSADGGTTFTPVFGNQTNAHRWTEFDFASDGKLAVALSGGFLTQTDVTPGVYVRRSGQATFDNVTPSSGYPTTVNRGVVAFAPSNPNVLYVMVNGGRLNDNEDDIRFFKITYNPADNTWTSSDRTANLPYFGGRTGFLNSQGDYNMVIAVKPDDENFVIIGLTNLYRSRDGFSTKAPETDAGKREAWIGGYSNTSNTAALYPNHHPDQHALVFDPANPNRLWSGHDGGLSFTSDISAVPVAWDSRNNGYNVTQFYTVALPAAANNNNIAGGTQDNGTRYFAFTNSSATTSQDVTGGDGSYTAITARYLYASTQNGNVYQYDFSARSWSANLKPDGSTDQLFIHPFAIDPRDDRSMVYPSGRFIYYNASLDLPNKATGWENVTSNSERQLPSGFRYSTLAFANTSPLVYLGASHRDSVPRFVVFNTSTRTVTIRRFSIAPRGAYIHKIAVHPTNDQELMVLLSNYNIPSIFHSMDGGVTFTDIEGNLAGNTTQPGPSIRSGVIARRNNGAIEYYVGTSTGLYSTTALNGSATRWVREGANVMGTAIVEDMAIRQADGRIALATHGRGMFVGNVNVAVRTAPASYRLLGNYPNPFRTSTVFKFDLPDVSDVRMEIFDMNGRLVSQPINRRFEGGSYEVPIRASGFASGVYIVRFTTRYRTEVKKITVVR